MNTKENLIEISIVTLMILLSKTVLFGIHYKKILLMALMILFGIMIFKKGDTLSKEALRTFFPIAISLLLGIIVNFSSLSIGAALPVVEFIMYSFGMVIVVSNVKKDTYCKIYINVLTIISLISLITFFVTSISPNLISTLSQKVQIGNRFYIVSPFHTWGFDSFIYPRNAGPFWEPGAFQGFILIALIMILYLKNNVTSHKIKFFTLSLTLMSTQSTAGYIIIGIVCMFFWKDILEIFSGNNKNKKTFKTWLLFPLVIFSIVYLVYLIVTSDTIVNKLTGGSISFAMRSNHLYNSFSLITEKPLFGYGNGLAKRLRESSIGIEDNSVGLLSLLYTYGIIFFTIYIYRFKRGLDSIFPFHSRIKRLSIYVIFTILFMTQGFYYLPVFIIFLYQWPKNQKRIDIELKKYG